METTPLSSWARARWIDMALSVAWLIDNGVGTAAQRATLAVLGSTLHSQGTDWDTWYASNFTTCDAQDCRHNVNNAQAFKSAAVWYRFSGNKTLALLSSSRMASLDA